MKNTDPSLTDLNTLEKTIVDGQRAYETRNALIVSLVESGVSQASVARHLNALRAAWGAPTITPDAIAATIKRVKKNRD
jgi:hypothetical protein